MKKFILSIIFIILAGFYDVSFADTESILNIHTNKAYILQLPYRALDICVSNERVAKAEAIADLYTSQSQLIIRSFEEGIAYIDYKTKNKPVSIKILVDNRTPESVKLIPIDKLEETSIK